MTKSDIKSALYNIVLRCRVSDSDADVLKYAQSRLNPGHWDKQTSEWQAMFSEACAELHEQNRDLYTSIVKGTL
jgi:hypothetical protein